MLTKNKMSNEILDMTISEENPDRVFSSNTESMPSKSRYMLGRLISGKVQMNKLCLALMSMCLIAILIALVAISVLYLQKETQAPLQVFSTSTVTTMVNANTTTEDPFGVGPWQNKRLPDWITPIEYNMLIRAYVSIKAYEGSVDIRAKVNKETQMILLHCAPNLNNYDPTVAVVDPQSGSLTFLTRKSSFKYPNNEYLVIELYEKMLPGQIIVISMQFNQELSVDSTVGFYLSTYDREK